MSVFMQICMYLDAIFHIHYLKYNLLRVIFKQVTFLTSVSIVLFSETVKFIATRQGQRSKTIKRKENERNVMFIVRELISYRQMFWKLNTSVKRRA